MRRFLSKPLGLAWWISTKAQIEAKGKRKGKNDVRLREIDPEPPRHKRDITPLREIDPEPPRHKREITPLELWPRLPISADYYPHFTQQRLVGLL